MNKHKKRGNHQPFWIISSCLLIIAYLAWAVLRPLPLLQPVPATRQFSVNSSPSKLTWPNTGQAAVAILGSSILETHGTQSPVPIASTAKVITALTVLDKKPLKTGEQGPTITLNDADVAFYNSYAANEGSLVPVVAGEQITEYQMLQAIMLPSANNIADSLAVWAFGSLTAYTMAANSYAAAHGMPNTHIGTDASGFSPTTTSTARDLSHLGMLAMNKPALAAIVGQETATGIPQTTLVKNVNSLLGTNNIVGVKTGNTDEAGGVFISASRVIIGGQPLTIVTTVVGSPTLFVALKDSLGLIRSAQSNFSAVTLARQGDVVGRYYLPWGGSMAAVASKNLSAHAWNGSGTEATIQLRPIAVTGQRGQNVGAITPKMSGAGPPASVDLRTSPTTPSFLWRLSHPLFR